MRGIVTKVAHANKYVEFINIGLDTKATDSIFVKGCDIMTVGNMSIATISNVRYYLSLFFKDVVFNDSNLIKMKRAIAKQFALYIRLDDLLYSSSTTIPTNLRAFLEEVDSNILKVMESKGKVEKIEFKDEITPTLINNEVENMTQPEQAQVTDILIQNLQKEVVELKERCAELVKKSNDLYSENMDLKSALDNHIPINAVEPVLTLQSLVDFLKTQGVTLTISPA